MSNMMRAAISLSLITLVGFAPFVRLQAQAREGVMGDLLNDLAEVEKKVLDLANAMPDSAWEWRPTAGVRSTGEVFQHIAADNYFMPALMEIGAPKETGITSDYSTAAAWEKRAMDKKGAIAELQKSFAFLRTSMTNATDEQLAKAYGRRKTSGRGLWIATVTHLHEHLGQLIAYARSNKITPPWSK